MPIDAQVDFYFQYFKILSRLGAQRAIWENRRVHCHHEVMTMKEFVRRVPIFYSLDSKAERYPDLVFTFSKRGR